MSRPVRVRMLRTLYPHWGAFAGINQYVKHLDRSRCRLDVDVVSDSDADLPLPFAGLRRRLRQRVQRRGMAWYKLSDLAAEMRMLPLCVLRRVDVVHFMDAEHTAQYLPSVLRRSRIAPTKTIGTFHQPVEMLDELTNRDIVAHLDHVNLVSPSQVPYFRAFLPAEKVSVILHGIDTEFFRPAPQKPRDGRFRCITSGHWLRDWDAIRGVVDNLRSERDIEFHVVTNRETGLESNDNVVFHKDISDAELLSRYQQADVLLLPLTGSTANNSLLEGIACGLPAVSTALESVKAYLPGDQGILVDENRAEPLTEAVLRLKRDPAFREETARNARRRAEELAWPKIAPQYAALYDAVFRGRPFDDPAQ